MHGYSYEYVELWNTFSRETRGYPTELWPHSAASPKRGGAFHRNRPPHFRTTPNLTSDTSVQKRGRNYECAGLIRGGARFVAASNKKKKKRKNRISPYSATPLSSPRPFSTFDLASLPAQCRPDLRCSYFISSDSEDIKSERTLFTRRDFFYQFWNSKFNRHFSYILSFLLFYFVR